MSDIKWIKITTDMFEHEKLDFIMSLPESDAIIVVWIRLLTLAGKVNAGGYVLLTESIPYTEEMLAHKFRKSSSVIRLALETLKRLKMVEFEGETIVIANWEKHQNVEAMDKVREYERIRKSQQRDKKKQLLSPQNDGTCPGNVPDSPGDVTVLDIDIDIDIEKEYIYPEIQDDTKIIFDHWNAKKIMRHREMTAAMKSHVNARLEKYTADEIVTAIDNYHAVISDSETYWYSHKFTLQEFVNPKNLVRFLTENNPFEVHRKNVVTFDKDKRGNDYSDHKMRLQEQMEGRNEYGDTRIS